jgi:SAM-dependent methyltransferase
MSTSSDLAVDFGKAASDYAQHRPGFPPRFFDEVARFNIGTVGQRVLDLGTGTGTLARGFSERGCSVVGVDPSPGMLEQAARLAAEAKLEIAWVEARAEETGLAKSSFDAISAGQCFHWFDRPRASAECHRLLRPGGRIVVAYFSYLPEPSSVAEATEALVLKHNRAWGWAGHDGRYFEALPDLEHAGFQERGTFDFVMPVQFTHEAWRGRFRACNGVLTQPPRAIAAFDEELKELLVERFSEPFISEHRLWGIVLERR